MPCIPEAEELGAPKPKEGADAVGWDAAAALLAAGAPKPNPPAAYMKEYTDVLHEGGRDV